MFKLISYIVVFIVLVGLHEPLLAKTLKNKAWVRVEHLSKPIYFEINGTEVELDSDIDKIVKYYRQQKNDYFFMKPMSKIGDSQKECARNIKNDLYLLRPKTDHWTKLPHDLTWSEDPYKDRNWRFYFQSWRFADCLMYGYISTKDIWYIERLKWLVEDWWKDNFKNAFPDREFSWNDHTIAKRLREMNRIFEFLKQQNGLDAKYARTALRAIYWHAEILSKEKSLYMRHHNHGLDQSFVLFQTAALHPEFTESKIWMKTAKNRLVDEINYALTDEGVHKENSPGYHAWVSAYCARINRFSKHYTGTTISGDDVRLQNEGLKFLTVITRPDGTLPILGDTMNNAHPRAHYPDLNRLPWYPQYLYMISNGKQGEKPAQSSYIFKESGYFIYRDDWDDGENSTHLVLKCGFLSKAHRHNDDGNILLYGLGGDWLIDSGQYGYQYDEVRDYIVSPSAHNISFPWNVKDATPGDKMHINSLKIKMEKYRNDWGITSAKLDRVVCKSHMYKGYTYKRVLNIKGRRSFLLEDEIVQTNDHNAIRKYATIFKVPNDKKIYIDEKERAIVITNQKKNAALFIHYNNIFDTIKTFTGRKGELESLTTAGYLRMLPSKTVAFIKSSIDYTASFKLDLIKNPVFEKEKLRLLEK